MNEEAVRVFGAVVILSGVLVLGVEEQTRPAVAVAQSYGAQASMGTAGGSQGGSVADALDTSRMDLRQTPSGLGPAQSRVIMPAVGSQVMPPEYDSQRDMSRLDNRQDRSFSPMSAPSARTESRR